MDHAFLMRGQACRIFSFQEETFRQVPWWRLVAPLETHASGDPRFGCMFFVFFAMMPLECNACLCVRLSITIVYVVAMVRSVYILVKPIPKYILLAPSMSAETHLPKNCRFV